MRNKLLVVPLLLLANSVMAQEGYSAKSLFFGEDDSVIVAKTVTKESVLAKTGKVDAVEKKAVNPIAKKKTADTTKLGASYFIRLKENNGTIRDVLASRKFKTGERFQLGIKVNLPNYVYILNEGPDGKVTQIYPQPGQDNFINAMGTVFLPSQGSFEFDKKPGTEQLLVYLSPTLIRDSMSDRIKKTSPDMDSAPVDNLSSTDWAACTEAPTAVGDTSESASGKQYASKGIAFSADPAPECAKAPEKTAGYASKGISFSDDSEPANGGQVASYVVKNTSVSDKSLYLKIKLAHE